MASYSEHGITLANDEEDPAVIELWFADVVGHHLSNLLPIGFTSNS